MQFHALLIASAALAVTACNRGAGGEAGDAGEANRAAAEANAIENLALPELNGLAPASAPTAANGQQYVELAGAGDLYEIESARLAIAKATRGEVRTLAQAILADHQRSTTSLNAAARQAEPALTAASRMNAEQQADVDALRAASGAGFDVLYLEQQVRAHEQALTLVTSYASEGEVESLRRHASTVAGPIQTHLSRARALVEEAAAPQPETAPKQ
jgi:putative membrane protein